MKREIVKLKDGTEIVVCEADYVFLPEINQLLLEGKQFLHVGNYNIRIDSIDMVKVEDIEKENCENEVQ